jgi:hypothetical protein
MSENDGAAGRLSETPAVPETVAVAVSVDASAAVDAISATSTTPRERRIRCLI